MARRTMPRFPLALAAAAVALLSLLPTAQAVPEWQAPLLREDVVAALHDPAEVQPHTQWKGYLRLSDGTNITAVSYQVCRVGLACFAPPAPAQLVDPVTWGFDTANYTVDGRPVDYQPGWRLGVKWWLTETRSNGTSVVVDFPHGPDVLSDECMGDEAEACADAHYLSFDVAKAPKGAGGPSPGLVVAILAVLAAVAAARRGAA